jgi:hypothetical protein
MIKTLRIFFRLKRKEIKCPFLLYAKGIFMIIGILGSICLVCSGIGYIHYLIYPNIFNVFNPGGVLYPFITRIMFVGGIDLFLLVMIFLLLFAAFLITTGGYDFTKWIRKNWREAKRLSKL